MLFIKIMTRNGEGRKFEVYAKTRGGEYNLVNSREGGVNEDEGRT